MPWRVDVVAVVAFVTVVVVRGKVTSHQANLAVETKTEQLLLKAAAINQSNVAARCVKT